jgi:hypothetical protein
VFGFLNLRELHAALSVSKSWLATVCSMRSLGASISPNASREVVGVSGFSSGGAHRNPALTFEAMSVSPLARHVTVLGTRDSGVEVSSVWLTLASQRLRGLHTLHLAALPTLTAGGPASVTLPPSLTNLSLSLFQGMGGYVMGVAAPIPSLTLEINSFLEAVGRLPLLRSFTLHLSYVAAVAVSEGLRFSGLHAAKSLEHFSLNLRDSWTEDQINDLRELWWLGTLRLEYPTPALLERLLRQPHKLQWKELTDFDSYTMNFNECARMSLLPSLESFAAYLRGAEDFDFLQRLPNLTRIRLNVAGCFLPGDDLVAALRTCSRVTELQLSFCKLDSQRMCTLLPGLPLLQRFTLEGERSLESLRCFAAGPICSTLTHLTLIDCKHAKMQPSELDHFHALRGLTHLHVLMPFTSPPSALQLQQLTPPSVVLPKLVEFKYERRF